MVPGSIADFLQASALLGGLAGFACAFWAATNQESTEKDSRLWANRRPRDGARTVVGSGLGEWRPERLPTASLTHMPARDTHARTDPAS